MLVYVLYAPLALAVAVLLAFSVRGAVRGYGNGRLTRLSLWLAADLAGSAALMSVGEGWARWAAVALVAAVAVPLLAPVTLMIVAAGIGVLTGKPIRWN